MSLTIGSLFSGIGGLELGLERAGLGPVVWQVESDPFCRSVLARHWPDVKRFEDVKTFATSGQGVDESNQKVDLICGGFPCQDISAAGKGAGLAGERSGLWFDFARIVGELRPQYVVVENVASGANRWVDAVRSGLAIEGYATLPIPLSAKDVGAPHLRRRVFVVGHANRNGESTQPVNAKVAGMSGNPGLADTKREQLREQPGRGGRGSGEGSAESGNASAAGSIADTESNRRSAEGERTEAGYPDWGCELRHGIETGRIPQPALCRMDDGVSAVVGRRSSVAPLRRAGASRHRREELRALGNAVIPQVAEVIGHVVMELAQ